MSSGQNDSNVDGTDPDEVGHDLDEVGHVQLMSTRAKYKFCCASIDPAVHIHIRHGLRPRRYVPDPDQRRDVAHS